MLSEYESRKIHGSGKPKYIDAHCHAAGYEEGDWALIDESNTLIMAVSEDMESSKKTLELAGKLGIITPCIGVHPWNIEEASFKDIEFIEKTISEGKAFCVGEVGLDLKFTPQTIDRQRVFFKEFLRIARDYDAILNLHAVGAWREVYDLVVKYDVNRAIFHWYNGPLDLINDIIGSGYAVSINVAAKMQDKHIEVIENVPLVCMLTESDGPYKYRGVRLSTIMIPELVELIAEIKSVSEEVVRETIYNNYLRILGL